jgi:UDP-N-acetylmuramyl pentapeptide phosphotransferase/UDP-N-acetylglucosamine-1-phosphate transferase
MHLFMSESLLVIVAAGLSWSFIGLYARMMQASRRLEPPNARSMHKTPVSVGAGIAMVGTMLVLWPWWRGSASGSNLALLAGIAGLGAVSWIDDRRGLSPVVRLIAQAVAVALGLAWLSPEVRLLPFLPVLAERMLLGLAWLWFINLFNFMDGIDGLAGSEAVAVAVGYLLLLTYADLDGQLWRLALVITASMLAYLSWNWYPANVLMGDAGSIPLGFLLALLMLDLALRGYWAAGLILPLYFVADATITLVRRARRGEKPWQAHREHLYQRAVLGGASQPAVVRRVGAANAVLIALALASISYPLSALLAASMVVAALLAHLERLAGRRHHDAGGIASIDT